MKKHNNIEEKRLKEQEVVEEMIHLYCKKNHGSKELCDDCREVMEYAKARSEKCPFMEEKTFCANCKVHCYKPMMREKIRTIMKFCGPRMLFYRPGMAIWHLICSAKEKKKQKEK